jgi:hypothetical protein
LFAASGEESVATACVVDGYGEAHHFVAGWAGQAGGWREETKLILLKVTQLEIIMTQVIL